MRAASASGGKGMRAVAAQDARLPPEGIGDHAHFFDAGGRPRIKGVLIVPRHAGITSVPAGACKGSPGGRRSIRQGRLSTGLTFEKAQWTSSTPPG